MLNAKITLGSIDDSGKGRRFKSRFIQPGLAGYPGQYGNVLVRKETLDNSLNTIVGAPVIINHINVTEDNADDLRVGVISNAYYNEKDGWYWCEGVIWDEAAQNLITDKGWSVSCSYDFLEQDDEGGTENNIPYDREFTKLNFVHLALVDNPRYERANIVFNSKTVENWNPNQKRNNLGQWVKDETIIQQKKDNLMPIEINTNDIPEFETKEQLGEWFRGIFEDLGSVTIEDTGIKIELYGGNAEREAFKRRLQQLPNKAVAKAFDKVVSKSIKVDERPKDGRHKHNQEQYFNKIKLGKDDYYDVDIFVDFLEKNHAYRYAGHKTTKIDNKTSTRDTQVINHIMLTKVDNSIITDTQEHFNPTEENILPNVKKNNAKEQEMALLEELKKLINNVENNKGEEMNEKKEVDNQKVDKRKIIDEIGGLLKGKVDEELWRTIIGKAEKLSYNESEAGTSDNACEDDTKDKQQEKVKNETKEDNKEYEELKKDIKKDAENKCNNSVDNAKAGYFERMNEIYNAATEPQSENTYMSRADKLKAAEEYFAK